MHTNTDGKRKESSTITTTVRARATTVRMDAATVSIERDLPAAFI